MEFEEVMISFLIVCLLTLVVATAVISNDDVDIDDELGPYMCEQHGYNFKDYEYTKATENTEFKLKIYCEKPNEEKISDGYLVLI